MTIKKYYEIIKAVIFGAVVVFIIFAGYNGIQYIKNYMNFNTNIVGIESSIQKRIDAQNREFKQITDNQARAHTEIVNSLKDEIKELSKTNKEVVKDIEEASEKIKSIGAVQTEMNVNLSRKIDAISDHTYKEGTGEYNEQYFKKIMAKAKDKGGNVVEIPLGWAMFFPNREPEKQWKTGIYPLEYYLKIIQTEQKTGQMNTYAEAWVETDQPKEYKDTKFPLTIKEMEFKQEKKSNKEFFLWAPHLNLNLDYSFSSTLDNNIAGGLSFSTMGYGITKNDLDWKFLEFGFNTNGKDFTLKLSPFSYNIGRHIPLISNTFLGPFVGFGSDGAVYGIGLSIPF